MEVIEAVANLISTHGVITVLIAVLIGSIIWKGKSIGNWMLDTLRAAETVRMLQESNIELRTQIALMQEQLMANNEIILKQTAQIADLSARLDSAQVVAKRHYSRSKKPAA